MLLMIDCGGHVDVWPAAARLDSTVQRALMRKMVRAVFDLESVNANSEKGFRAARH